jgi:hypothetical protein
MKMSKQLSTAIALSGALFVTGASAATVIDTVSGWNGTEDVSSWGGIPGTEVYGQSITAPVATSLLTGFSFKIRDTTAPIAYNAFVYAWNGTSITGPALFSLNGQSVGGGGSQNFLPVSFSTSVAVNPGSQYMLFLSTIGAPAGDLDTNWGYRGDDVYAGGGFHFFNTTDFGTLSTPWETFVGGGKDDLAFTATFDGTTVVPVPGALGLMLSGAVALGFLGRRRRNVA